MEISQNKLTHQIISPLGKLAGRAIYFLITIQISLRGLEMPKIHFQVIWLKLKVTPCSEKRQLPPNRSYPKRYLDRFSRFCMAY